MRRSLFFRSGVSIFLFFAPLHSACYAKTFPIADDLSKVSAADLRHINRGLDLYSKRRADPAAEEFSRCSEFSALTDACLLRMAWICFEASKFELTQKILGILIDRCDKTGKPSDALFVALDWRSYCGTQMNQLDQSLSDCQRLLTFDITYKDRIYEREAEIYIKQKKFDEGLKVYDLLDSKKGFVSGTRYKRGVCLQRMGRYADAIDTYTCVLKKISNPAHVNFAEKQFAGSVYAERAKCYDKLGKKELAVIDRSHAVDMTKSVESDFFPSGPPPAIK
jgi:tetratricopeptide (TPR) repeat protein